MNRNLSPALAILAATLSLLTTAPGEEAPKIGRSKDGVIVSTEQLIRPAGVVVEFNGRPVDLVVAPDGKSVYVKDNRGLVVIDQPTWTVRQQIPVGGGSMHGIAVSGDGRGIYLTTAGETLWEGKVAADARVSEGRKIRLPGPDGKGSSYPCGVTLTPDSAHAVVCLSINNTLAVVDLSAGKVEKEIPVGVAPYHAVLSPDAKTAYVSNWGGRRAGAGDKTGLSAKTKTVIDARGIGASGTVSIVDMVAQREIAQIETGLHPTDLCLSRDSRTLFVANANSDTVSVIDVGARRVIETIPVRPDPSLPFGSAPNSLALSEDGGRLYVANGGNNAVAVVDRRGRRDAKSALAGFVPAGWYPGAVAVRDGQLYVANVKGVGSLAKIARKEPGHYVKDYLGTVSKVALPTPAQLAAYTKQALADARVHEALAAWEKAQAPEKPAPAPQHDGEPSVFDHVVYIIKENRTYDQVLGDMPRGNGDPSLCIFGKSITPNHHALAEEFVLLDNYYCNSVLSADGHAWATEANAGDYFEKAFGGFTRVYFQGDPLTASSSGFLWDAVLLHGLSFRNYGEKDFPKTVPDSSWLEMYDDWTSGKKSLRMIHSNSLPALEPYSAPYPGWNLKIPDVVRADIFLKELAAFEKAGNWPRFMIVYLPSDHTSGTIPGTPTPRAMLADNDLALGRIVEGISKSAFWPTTCIFAIEDDPQAGFDHVDGHRSFCLVASPYTKRGQTIHAFYNQTSVLHTMERMMGLSPMTQFDSMAPVMTDCFTDKPDLRPYAAKANQIPLDELNGKVAELSDSAARWAKASAKQNFEEPDRVDDDTMNRILWFSVKGETAYPKEFAGAHGKGLPALHLKLDRKVDSDD
ncbi:MAG TPA: alkaline phosphatase family protein [Tepidisphaeraceae bacterium]|nr:alkaline phosphatase family protein [Tepidisphaeraceae bacterium]